MKTLIQKIKKEFGPLLLVCYFLFTQVYPYLHFHVHPEDVKNQVRFVFHPVDGCEFHHDGTGTHHHHEGHVCGDWKHTVQEKAKFFFLNGILASNQFQYFSVSPELQIQHTLDLVQPFFFSSDLPQRAPPVFC